MRKILDVPYFNHAIIARDAATASWLDRRDFARNWWRLYEDDQRWTPPAYSTLTRELQPGRNPHLARLMPGLVRVEALYRTNIRTSRQDQPVPLANVFEQPLAAAVYTLDPRRTDRAGYLALLQTSSDEEGLQRLLSHAREAMRPLRVKRVIGPVGMSPHLDSGVLVDSWDAWPPLHTPSNPPYLPERLAQRMDLLQTGRLYQAAVPDSPLATDGPAALEPLEPARLAGDLLPLLGEATANPTAGFVTPDEAEAAFLLRWLGGRDLLGWTAVIDNQPVGFVLLGPDSSLGCAAGRRRTQAAGSPLGGGQPRPAAGGPPLLWRCLSNLSPAGRRPTALVDRFADRARTGLVCAECRPGLGTGARRVGSGRLPAGGGRGAAPDVSVVPAAVLTMVCKMPSCR